MNLANLMFKDVVKFMAEQDKDLIFIVMLLDYIFADIELDITSEAEVQAFIQNMRIIADLYMLLGLTVDLSDRQRDAYDSDYIAGMNSEPSRLLGLKKFKLALHQKLNKDLIPEFDEYRKERGI